MSDVYCGKVLCLRETTYPGLSIARMGARRLTRPTYERVLNRYGPGWTAVIEGGDNESHKHVSAFITCCEAAWRELELHPGDFTVLEFYSREAEPGELQQAQVAVDAYPMFFWPWNP